MYEKSFQTKIGLYLIVGFSLKIVLSSFFVSAKVFICRENKFLDVFSHFKVFLEQKGSKFKYSTDSLLSSSSTSRNFPVRLPSSLEYNTFEIGYVFCG